MNTIKWIEDIRDALGAIDSVDMDERHRKTIFRCLRSELVEATDRRDALEETARDGKRWTEEELKLLRDTLTGRKAMSWAQEKMNVLEAALKLGRNNKATKKKAVELGLSEAVDYWLNREE